MIQYLQREDAGSEQNAAGLAKALGVSLFTARLLCRRGHDSEASARAFLHPELSALHDPFLFEQMGDAVDCIVAALDMGERICVYGDYDVDGIMAVALLSRYLTSLGGDVFSYIPERRGEGYGLNKEAIDKVVSSGAALMITVDCGITAIEEVEYAYELGLPMIVTDHHQRLETLPECEAVINPVCSKTYPFKSLCGAGVALKLVQALGGDDAIRPYIQYATLATIADIVELSGENRVIAHAGLELINSSECIPGIKALAEASGYVNRHLDETAIGFALAPRINAAGRTGSPERALRLFMTDDPQTALKQARELDEENRRRQEIEGKILKQALSQIRDEIDIVDDCAIILTGENWNPGVIGIVASRLVERFSKPVILLARDGDSYVGSGRSVKGIHLFNMLSSMGDLFSRFGGHEMAAGLTISPENVPEFRRRVRAELENSVDKDVYIPKVYYDMELPPDSFTLELAESIGVLAPFGIGNPAPVFRTRGTVGSPRYRGADKAHISFLLNGKTDCIAFSCGRRFKELAGENADMLCTIKINTFRECKPQCEIKQIRVCPGGGDCFMKGSEWLFQSAFFETPHDDALQKDFKAERFNAASLESALRANPQGTLMLCFTVEGARGLLDFASSHDLTGCFDTAVEQISDERAYNTALFAPKLCDASLCRFKRVFVCDACPSAPALGSLVSSGARLFFPEKAPDMRAFFDSLKLDRDSLIPVYKTMLTLSAKTTSFASFDDYREAVCRIKRVEPFALYFALRVFSELGFFDKKLEGALIITPAKNARKCELSQSPTFILAQNADNEYYKLMETLDGRFI